MGSAAAGAAGRPPRRCSPPCQNHVLYIDSINLLDWRLLSLQCVHLSGRPRFSDFRKSEMREGELINLIFTNAPRFIVSDLILRVRGRGRRGGGAQGPGCGEPASKGTMRELRSAHRLTRPQRPPGLEMRQNPGRSASVRPGAVGGGKATHGATQAAAGREPVTVRARPGAIPWLIKQSISQPSEGMARVLMGAIPSKGGRNRRVGEGEEREGQSASPGDGVPFGHKWPQETPRIVSGTHSQKEGSNAPTGTLAPPAESLGGTEGEQVVACEPSPP